MPTDHELLLRMTRGDEGAARELWRRYGARLSAYAAAMLRTPGADASSPLVMDAVQSVFLRVISMDRHTLAGVEHVGAWLTTGVRHAVLNLVRSGARQESLHLRLVRPIADDQRASDDSLDTLHRALDRLPDDAREVLLLKYVARLTLDQMALSLGVNRNTLASRVQAAMERLREAMAEADGRPHAHDARETPVVHRGVVRP